MQKRGRQRALPMVVVLWACAGAAAQAAVISTPERHLCVIPGCSVGDAMDGVDTEADLTVVLPAPPTPPGNGGGNGPGGGERPDSGGGTENPGGLGPGGSYGGGFGPDGFGGGGTDHGTW